MDINSESPLFTPQLSLMGNKCGAFLQSYPDAPVVHVEKLSMWTGSEGAWGKLWDKRLQGEMNQDGGEGMEDWLDVQGQGEGSEWIYIQTVQEG